MSRTHETFRITGWMPLDKRMKKSRMDVLVVMRAGFCEDCQDFLMGQVYVSPHVRQNMLV